MNVKGRAVLITGSGSGLGEEMAKSFARNGARVVVNDINYDQANRVKNEIIQSGHEAISCVADISNKIQVEEMLDQVKDNFGAIDILVNNAGIAKDRGLLKMTEEDWDSVININMKGTFLCCQAAVKQMREQQYGRIINISSRAWLGWPGQSNYSASKGGIVSLTRTLALELAKYQITVNCIAPGIINTPLFQALPEESKASLMEVQPTGTIGDAKDISYGALFFAADESSYVTGQVIFICGGKSVLSSLSV
jgi:NAD(P)-dependent dehydrogenase (short-subunit alcohol dehydrogenase family)